MRLNVFALLMLTLLFVGTAGVLAASDSSADGAIDSERPREPTRSLAAASPTRPLQTAILDDPTFVGDGVALAFARARSTGATALRLGVRWSDVAPRRPSRPADPADAAYRWQAIDRAVTRAARNGLSPILSLYAAPRWAAAEGDATGTRKPDPAEYGRFARAAATRYSGSFRGLPRVRYWQVWNEPNISLFLTPQFEDGRPFSPGLYRRLVNSLAASVYAVRRDNLVVAGGTAPFRDITASVVRVNPRWGPLTFMRELLCLDASLRRKCRAPVRFDVWAHHPYSSGGPDHHALLPDDVSVADLPEMRRVLQAGVRARNVISRRAVAFWITEFSWDSNPPDARGVPLGLQARWVSEALYRMWQAGVSLVTWFSIRDDPLGRSFYQSSLFFRGSTAAADRPKPALQAFRFPVVALRAGPSRILVWGRTPWGKAGRVALEHQTGAGWRRLAVVATTRNGIFQRTLRASPTGSVRGVLLGRNERSRPFSLATVPDRFFNPFGQETILERPRLRG